MKLASGQLVLHLATDVVGLLVRRENSNMWSVFFVDDAQVERIAAHHLENRKYFCPLWERLR